MNRIKIYSLIIKLKNKIEKLRFDAETVLYLDNLNIKLE